MPNSDIAIGKNGSSDSPYDDLISEIAAYAYHYDVQSERAMQQARVALLDAIGCVIECLKTNQECTSMVGPVVPGTSVPNGFKLPGTAYQLDPVKGAFDMSSLTRYLDHNDAFPGAEWGHPSGSCLYTHSHFLMHPTNIITDNLGAILAVSDWQCRTRKSSPGTTHGGPPMTMKTVLTAMTKAYEIQGCFQIANAFNKVGLDHTILVKVASTALVAWLMGLTEAEAVRALSHAWIDGHPLRIFRQAPNAGPRKGWAAGDATMRAVHLCFLMRAGQPGIPTALTDPDWGFQKTSFGGAALQLPRPFQSWVMENVFFKLIPAEGHGISAVEAAVQLCAVLSSKGLNAATDIARIKVRTHEAACRIIDKRGPLSNAADRDHCMRYMLAVVLLKGTIIETADYTDSSPWAQDPRVESLRQKIDMTEDKQFTHDYHYAKKKSAASGLTIELVDGSMLDEVVVEHPLGHPGRKDTIPAVRNKFRQNMRLMFEDTEIDHIINAVENDAILISDFTDLLVRSEPAKTQAN
jgi:2-methylcitrate dehydratase